MTLRIAALAALIGMLATGCGHQRDREAARERGQQDQGSAAFKAGKVAHEIAKETGKAAAVAGRKLEQSARKAHEGWQQQAREDKEKGRESH